jgi:hypothetical protein
VSKQLTWDGNSTMSGSGSTTLAAGATGTLGGASGTAVVLDQRIFNNHGKISYPNNGTLLEMGDGAVFNNQAGATFTDGEWVWPSAGAIGTFNNAGTFTVSGGPGWFYGVVFNNTGTVNVQSNRPLELDNGGKNSGKIVLSSGSQLDLAYGTYNFDFSTSSITGAGSVCVTNGTAVFGGTYNITGDTGAEGGTAKFLNGGSTGTFGASFLTNGTFEFAAGKTFTVKSGNYVLYAGSTYLNGGTIAVSPGAEVDLEQGAALYGPGTIDGNLVNGVGTAYSPSSVYVGGGQQAGTLTINGNYSQDSNSSLNVFLGGSTAGTQYDQMKVSGTASLNDILDVSLAYGYFPPSGTAFSIMTYASESRDFSTKFLDGLSLGSPGTKAYVLTA